MCVCACVRACVFDLICVHGCILCIVCTYMCEQLRISQLFKDVIHISSKCHSYRYKG